MEVIFYLVIDLDTMYRSPHLGMIYFLSTQHCVCLWEQRRIDTINPFNNC